MRAALVKELFLSEFLTSLVWNGELYYPRDNPFYQATYFKPARLEGIQNAWEKTLRLIREGRAPSDIGLYIHWPFCPSHCDFCACSMLVPKNNAEMEKVYSSIIQEINSFSHVFSGMPLSSLWMGGGTPTFMTDEQLDALLSHIRASFAFSRDAQIYIEASPATLTDSKLDILIKHGVNRITLGVQSLNDEVASTVNRQGQTREKVLKVFRKLKSIPELILDVDMMLGIERQSFTGFLRDMNDVLLLRPHLLHVYSFDDRPQVPWLKRREVISEDLRKEYEGILKLADRLSFMRGYRQQRDDGELSTLYPWEERQDGGVRKFRSSVLGIGPSAISHAYGSAWYTHPPVVCGSESQVSPFFWMESSIEEEMRGYAIWYLSQTRRLARKAFLDLFQVDVMETALASVFHRWEKERKVVIGQGFISLQNLDDLVDREVFLKGLYSEEIMAALISRWSKEIHAFVCDANSEALLRQEIRRKNSVPGFRVYHDAKFWRES